MRMRTLILILIATLFLLSPFYSIKVNAGTAGVGVLNVSPKISELRVVQQDNFFRIYITASDYNSWEDIYTVSIILEDYGTQTVDFLFKQYEDETKYKKIDEFSEIPESGLLVKERCSVQRSSEKETITDKCELELILVFYTVWFSQLNIVITDREGGTSTANIDYNAEELMRSDTLITIPSLDEPISVAIPPYLLNSIAILISTAGTIILIKRAGRQEMEAGSL